MEIEREIRRKLIPVNISYSESDNIWTFDPQESGYSKLNFKANEEKLRRLLRRMRAKDSLTYPNSKKGITYQKMIDDIESKGKSSIYVWRSNCPTTLELIQALMEK